MKRLLAGIIILTTINCNAQDAPAAVKTAFTKSFPGITVKKWDKEDGNYEANFTKDGKSMSATYDAKGDWMETETDIKVTELPAAVAEYVKANYKGATIKEAAIISNLQSKKQFEAEVKGKDLLFDENGKFLKEEQD